MTDEEKALVRAVKAFIAAVEYDECGVNGKGGNGGLISRETLRKMGEARRQLSLFTSTKQASI